MRGVAVCAASRAVLPLGLTIETYLRDCGFDGRRAGIDLGLDLRQGSIDAQRPRCRRAGALGTLERCPD